MIREWLRERGYHWHTQNLNERRDGSGGPKWRHGRGWFKSYEHGNLPGLAIEWVHGKLNLDAWLQFDRYDREAQLHIAIPGASYYLTIENLPKSLFERLPFDFGNHGSYGSPRNTGFRVFGGALWLSLWETTHMSSHRDPWWMRARIGLDDIANRLFGKTQYATRTLHEHDVAIPMPEGTYPAKVKITHSTWTRARWPWRPFSKERIGSQVDIPKGIGFPGKGENDYDCGDDALFGLSSNAKTVEEAIGAVVSSVLRNRKRYGGSHGFTPRDAGSMPPPEGSPSTAGG